MAVRCSELVCCPPVSTYRSGAENCPPGYTRNEETGECEPPPICDVEPILTFDPPNADTVLFPVTVTLSSNYLGQIYYTTDGSTPTTESTPYTVPFSVEDPDTTVKALLVTEQCGEVLGEASWPGPPGDGIIGWYIGDEFNDVTGWPDNSGLNNHLDRVNGNYHRITNQLNSHDIVRGASHALAYRLSGAFTIGGARTGYTAIVVRRRTNGSFSANLALTNCNSASADELIFSSISGSVDTITGVGFAGESAAQHTVTVNVWHVLSFTFDNTEQIARLYSNTQSSTGAVSGGSVLVDNASTQDGAGEVAEMIFYRKKLSTQELAQARNYLAAKYGLTISV